MKVLAINTYGGSLLLGARAAGAEIIGSYEDKGFGSSIQEANFPHLDIRRKRHEWPESQDLSETIVIAHPPCSAFSVQTLGAANRGTESDAFSCTKAVLDYATRNRALAVCVESVTGALGGAWGVHQRYADDYGYDLYRVLQCGAMFGAQWRERFWAIWVRRGALRDRTLRLALTPRWMSVAEAIRGYEDGPGASDTDQLLARLKRYVEDNLPVTSADMSYLFDAQDPPHKTRGFARAVQQRLFPSEPIDIVQLDFLGVTFSTGQMCYVDPRGLAPCLLGSSWWYVNGRNMTEKGYKRVMGFPADYVFPDKVRRAMRMYLSKGVMPPVAEWILRQVTDNLEGRDLTGTYSIDARPNSIADFRFKKRHWGQERPELRTADESGDEEVA